MSLRATRRRKRLSMTSLIDVIFLLLLFFMLSSTFSRFAEVELLAGGIGGNVVAEDTRTLFLRLSENSVSLNGEDLDTDALADSLRVEPGPATVLVSVTDSASAQLLTDVLVTLRNVPELSVSVLEAS